MGYKYEVTLLIHEYTKAGDAYGFVDVDRTFTFDDYEEVADLLGLLIHGAGTDGVTFKVRTREVLI